MLFLSQPLVIRIVLIVVACVFLLLAVLWLVRRLLHSRESYNANIRLENNIKILYDQKFLIEGKQYFSYNPSIFRSADGSVRLMYRISNAIYDVFADKNWNKEFVVRTPKLPAPMETLPNTSHSFLAVDRMTLPDMKLTHERTEMVLTNVCSVAYGLEDPRAFTYNGEDYALCMEYRLNLRREPVAGVVLYNLKTGHVLPLFHPLHPDQFQKNWLPFVHDGGSKLLIVSDSKPHRVLEPDLSTGQCTLVAETENPFVLDGCRGSAGYIHIPGYYIGVLHYQVNIHTYSHFFYAFQDVYPFNAVAASDRYCVDLHLGGDCKNTVQMVTGIMLDTDSNVVYITGGHYDRNCFAMTMPISKLIQMLNIDPSERPIRRLVSEQVTNRAELQSQKIPRKVLSIMLADNIPMVPSNTIDCIETWIVQSPEYEFTVMSSSDCNTFLHKFFPANFLRVFQATTSDDRKIALFSACWLYMNGGVYKDIRQRLLVPLAQVIHPDSELIATTTSTTGKIETNEFLACTARHPMMNMYLQALVSVDPGFSSGNNTFENVLQQAVFPNGKKPDSAWTVPKRHDVNNGTLQNYELLKQDAASKTIWQEDKKIIDMHCFRIRNQK